MPRAPVATGGGRLGPEGSGGFDALGASCAGAAATGGATTGPALDTFDAFDAFDALETLDQRFGAWMRVSPDE